MARETGQYRKMLLEQQAYGAYHTYPGVDSEGALGVVWFRIQFYISLILFLAYVMLDYTGTTLYSLDSDRILAEIQKDMTHELHIDALMADIMEQIEITEESSWPAGAVPEEDSSPEDLPGEPALKDPEEEVSGDYVEEI
ncbi:MAG: hypothetical protein HFI33_01380 [Lachnospiraceae bacterium]|nr:hypothetical protein [Lachnospiraceae bacterium]